MRVWISIGVVAVLLVVGCLTKVRADDTAKANEKLEKQRIKNLQKIGIALLNYEAAYRHFPPSKVLDKASGMERSWRVEILPQLGEQKLYNEYHKDEPWDSEHNKKLIAKMPKVFQHPADKSMNSSYFVPVGELTLFSDPDGLGTRQVIDGTSKTILLIEAKRDIPWTKPEDIEVAPEKLPEFGYPGSRGFGVSTADAAAYLFRDDTPDDKLREMLTIEGSEPVDPSDYRLPR